MHTIFSNQNQGIDKPFWKFSMILAFLSVLSFLYLARAYDPTYLYHFCPNTTTFTRNSVYQSNLNLLLSNISSNATRGNKFLNGFYIATVGQEPNKVYGMFLCRGDQTTSACKNCVNFATSDVTRRCPVEKETVIWYDECLLRYSNDFFFSTMSTEPIIMLSNSQNVTKDPSNTTKILDQEVWNLMNKTSNEALDSPKMFGTAKENSTDFQTLYSLAQCSPDLSRGDCSSCIRQAIPNLVTCCSEKQGGRVLYPSCNIRYELYRFYDETLTPAPTPMPAPFPSPSPDSVTKSKGPMPAPFPSSPDSVAKSKGK